MPLPLFFQTQSQSQGQLARLQRVYERYRAEFCAVARAMGADAYTAEDAVQEAWLRLTRPEVLETLDTKDPKKLHHLMLLAVRNAVCNLHRRTSPDQPGDEILRAVQDSAPGPAQTVEEKDAAARLWTAVDTLGEPDRSILLLKYADGCSGRQIAALLDLSEDAVRQRASRARKKLKTMLEKEAP